MFERFTPAAKELVVEAQARRSALGEPRVGTHHLLLALLVDNGPTGDALRRHGLDAERIAARLDAEAATETTTSASDDQLLRGLGIDVDAIRATVDKTFGSGALDRARDRRARRPRHSSTGRGGRWDAHSKKVMELSLREALRLKHKHIGPEHIGLGMLREGKSGGESTACRLLGDEGVDLVELRAAWEAVASGATTRSR